ncbi:MAG: hypothetical protein AAF725_04035 [Acidobacteriota bacterium]
MISRRPAPPRAHARLAGCALAAAALLAAPSALKAQEPTLRASDRAGEIEQIEIGNDLFISLEGGRPHADYRLDLLDETGAVIATAKREADPWGRIDGGDGLKAPLWERTGVIGCDITAPYDPERYLYRDLDEADALLGGRQFEIEARELPAGQPVASLQLPLTAERSKPVFFFTDATGCPRQEFHPGEGVYMVAQSLRGQTPGAWLVLAAGDSSPEVDDPLVDARGPGAGPQGIDLEPNQEYFIELVWASAEIGTYGAVVRLVRDEALIFREGDRWIGYEREAPGISPSGGVGGSVHGITVVPWDLYE